LQIQGRIAAAEHSRRCAGQTRPLLRADAYSRDVTMEFAGAVKADAEHQPYPGRTADDGKPPRCCAVRLEWLLGLCLLSACAHNLSSDLRFDDTLGSKAVLQTVVLGVDPPADKSQTYQLEKFVQALREAQLFKAVEYPDRASTPDLILTSFSFYTTNPLRACFLGFQGQVLTIGTLGLFPQLCKSEFNVSFSLYSPSDKGQRKNVSVAYQTRSIMGWAAVFYLPFPDWTANPPEERNVEVLRAAFNREADDIRKLLRK
jgi:hypothetical protein